MSAPRQSPGFEVEVLHQSGNKDSKFRVWVEELTFPDLTAAYRMRVAFPILGPKDKAEEEEIDFWCDSLKQVEFQWKCKQFSPFWLHHLLSKENWIWSPEDQVFLQPGQFERQASRRYDE